MKKWFGIGIMMTAIVFILFNLTLDNEENSKLDEQIVLKEPSFEYGILADSFLVVKGVVKNGQRKFLPNRK